MCGHGPWSCSLHCLWPFPLARSTAEGPLSAAGEGAGAPAASAGAACPRLCPDPSAVVLSRAGYLGATASPLRAPSCGTRGDAARAPSPWVAAPIGSVALVPWGGPGHLRALVTVTATQWQALAALPGTVPRSLRHTMVLCLPGPGLPAHSKAQGDRTVPQFPHRQQWLGWPRGAAGCWAGAVLPRWHIRKSRSSGSLYWGLGMLWLGKLRHEGGGGACGGGGHPVPV